MRSVIFAITFTFASGSAVVLAQSPSAAPVFPDGALVAYIDIARIAGESTEGQAANTAVQELTEQKFAELEAANTAAQGRVGALNEQLIAAQQKFQQGQNVISAEAASSLQREISRLQVDIERASQDSQADIQRMTQDAEAEVQELQVRLQGEFETKLIPAIDKLASDRGLSFIFNSAQGLVWADPSLDLTQELIDSLNSAAGTP